MKIRASVIVLLTATMAISAAKPLHSYLKELPAAWKGEYQTGEEQGNHTNLELKQTYNIALNTNDIKIIVAAMNELNARITALEPNEPVGSKEPRGPNGAGGAGQDEPGDSK